MSKGLHVPPGDASALAAALRRLLEDEPLRLRLGAAGPAKAANFALSQVLPRLDEVYRTGPGRVGPNCREQSRSGTAALSREAETVVSMAATHRKGNGLTSGGALGIHVTRAMTMLRRQSVFGNEGVVSMVVTEGRAEGMSASTADGSAKTRSFPPMPLVLMYHSISPYDEDPYEVTMTPSGSNSNALAAPPGPARGLDA